MNCPARCDEGRVLAPYCHPNSPCAYTVPCETCEGLGEVPDDEAHEALREIRKLASDAFAASAKQPNTVATINELLGRLLAVQVEAERVVGKEGVR